MDQILEKTKHFQSGGTFVFFSPHVAQLDQHVFQLNGEGFRLSEGSSTDFLRVLIEGFRIVVRRRELVRCS